MLICSVREEEAIQLDGLNAAQIKELREKSEKHAFQAEVNRMMKLIINSLYKNKEVSSDSRMTWFLRMTCFCFNPRGLRSGLKIIEQFQGHGSAGKHGTVTWIMVHDDQVTTQNAFTCKKCNILVQK